MRNVGLSALLGAISSIALSIYGYQHHWTAFFTLVIALLCSQLLTLILSSISFWLFYPMNNKDSDDKFSYMDFFNFFWPVCLSGMSFGVSRPLLYAFISRTPDALLTIASLRVSFDFFMLAQTAVNQFRNIFPSLGMSNLRKKRKFMVAITLIIMILLTICLIPPFDIFIFKEILGLNQNIFTLVRLIILILMISPIILIVRNYYHSILLYCRQTKSMAVASAFRVITIIFSSAVLLHLGWLNYLTAAFIMILAFITETIVVAVIGHRALQLTNNRNN